MIRIELVFPGVIQRAGCCWCAGWLVPCAVPWSGVAVLGSQRLAGSQPSAPAPAPLRAPVRLGTPEPRLPWLRLREDDPLQPDQCHQAGTRSDMTYGTHYLYCSLHAVQYCTGELCVNVINDQIYNCFE